MCDFEVPKGVSKIAKHGKMFKNQSQIGKSLILAGGFSFKVEITFFEKKRAEGKILISAGGFMVKVAIVFFTIFIKSLV